MNHTHIYIYIYVHICACMCYVYIYICLIRVGITKMISDVFEVSLKLLLWLSCSSCRHKLHLCVSAKGTGLSLAQTTLRNFASNALCEACP